MQMQEPLLLPQDELFLYSMCHINKIFWCLNCFYVLQLTGMLIGAVVAVCLIAISVLFLYRRYKLASMFKSSVPGSLRVPSTIIGTPGKDDLCEK